MGVRLLAALCLVPLATAWAQDERRVVSPDGHLEFRIFIAQSDRGGLSRLAYRVLRDGKPLVETSYLGLNIHNQEPFLGENVGLIGDQTADTADYRSLIAHYMQNGSIGRLIDVEARVSNDSVAFRYHIPPSTALLDIAIDDELTEFDVVGPARISEVLRAPYPFSTFVKRADGVVATKLARPYPDAVTAFETKAPFTGPWRVISLQ